MSILSRMLYHWAFAVAASLLVSVAGAWTCPAPVSPPSDDDVRSWYESADIVVMASPVPRDPFLYSPAEIVSVQKVWKGQVPPTVAIRDLNWNRQSVIFADGPGEDGGYEADYSQFNCVDLRDRSMLERKLDAIYGIGSPPNVQLGAQTSSWFIAVSFLCLVGVIGFAGFVSSHLTIGWRV